MLWINSPCIVVGKNQNTTEEVNQRFCDDNDIKIVRRVSGGGAVYHDLNNLNYTIISRSSPHIRHAALYAIIAVTSTMIRSKH